MIGDDRYHNTGSDRGGLSLFSFGWGVRILASWRAICVMGFYHTHGRGRGRHILHGGEYLRLGRAGGIGPLPCLVSTLYDIVVSCRPGHGVGSQSKGLTLI